MRASSSPLPLSLKLGYGTYDFGATFFLTITSFWFFIYLTDVLGLKPGLAGIAIVFVRIAEILASPLCGYFANHIQTRWGRRRPFLLFGAIPAGIAFVVLFWGPPLTSQITIFVWALMSFLIVSLLFTVMNIPYSALTVDLTPDPHQRTVLNAWRIAWATVGALMAAATVQPLLNLFPTALTGYRAIGILFGTVIVISTLTTFVTVRETKHPVEGSSKEGFIFSHKLALTSRKLVLFLVSYLVTMTAVSLTSAAIPYYFKYILHRENMASPAIGILIVASILFIPFWVLLSKRIGKKISYIMGMVWMGIFIFLISIFATGLTITTLIGGMVVVGFGYAAIAALPLAILPDVIDDHYNATGRRHEGIAYGLWLVAAKSGMLLAAGIFGAVLSFTNYQPEISQTAILQQKTVIGIVALTGPIPFVLLIIASIIMWWPSPALPHLQTGHGSSTTKQ